MELCALLALIISTNALVFPDAVFFLLYPFVVSEYEKLTKTAPPEIIMLYTTVLCMRLLHVKSVWCVRSVDR